MDMTNKQIKIVSTAVTSYPAKTEVSCQVLQDQGNGVRVVLGAYDMTFEEIYQGPGDPNLLAAVVERLSAL